MLLEIGVQPVAKAVFAQPAFQHQQNRRALLIDHAIVHIARGVPAVNRNAYRTRARGVVHGHHALARGDRRKIRALGRLLLVHHLGRDPGGETFAQPDIVPGGLGDQVAEPLMTDLMGFQLTYGARKRMRSVISGSATWSPRPPRTM